MFSFFNKRELFRYWDGEKKRAIDPIQPWDVLLNCEGLDKDYEFLFSAPPEIAPDADASKLELIRIDTQNRLETARKVADVVRLAFGVKPWDESTGKGLTVNESLELLASYYEYAGSLKKSTAASPKSQPSTELVESSTTPKKKRSTYFGSPPNDGEQKDSSKPSQQPSAAV